jgi:3-hydroxybutyryl-CoA dehydrogenase
MNVDDIRSIAVVGAGLMGHGIAQEFALAGYAVHLHDLSDEKLQQATATMQANLQFLTDLGLVTHTQREAVVHNIHPSTVLKEVVGDADVVIEAVFEQLELKLEVFQQLDQLCPERTILASNSSTLLPSKLAAATRRPEQVLIAHYFNPPYLLPLVELVRHPATSDATVTTMYDLLTHVGKRPAIVQKEVPGFIGNRLQGALFREALSLVEQGIASAQDVDTVVKNGFGRRYAAAGPFEIWELAGWDFILAASHYLTPTLESSTEISVVLKEKVAHGELGVKTGKGFYEWTPESVEALKKRIGQALATIAQLS